MTLTKTQAEAIATACQHVRHPDHPVWDRAGILAALRNAADAAPPADIARALMHLAANPELRTPAMLAQPGPHWTRPDGTSARRDTHATRCHRHPSSVEPCPVCRAEAAETPTRGAPSSDVMAEVRAAIQRGKHALETPRRPPGETGE